MHIFKDIVNEAITAKEFGKGINVNFQFGNSSGILVTIIPEDIEYDDEILNIYMSGDVMSIHAKDVTKYEDGIGYICGEDTVISFDD